MAAMTADDYLRIFVDESATAAASDRLLLRHWSADQWSALFSNTTVKPFRASDVVIQLGAVDRALYLVAEGILEVGVSTFDGVSVSTIARIGARSVIGEQSFFDGQMRSANVWAVTEGTLLRWEFDGYVRFGQEEPELTRDFLFAAARILSTRLRLTTIRVRR